MNTLLNGDIVQSDLKWVSLREEGEEIKIQDAELAEGVLKNKLQKVETLVLNEIKNINLKVKVIPFAVNATTLITGDLVHNYVELKNGAVSYSPIPTDIKFPSSLKSVIIANFPLILSQKKNYVKQFYKIIEALPDTLTSFEVVNWILDSKMFIETPNKWPTVIVGGYCTLEFINALIARILAGDDDTLVVGLQIINDPNNTRLLDLYSQIYKLKQFKKQFYGREKRIWGLESWWKEKELEFEEFYNMKLNEFVIKCNAKTDFLA